jgi:hypothetical protein
MWLISTGEQNWRPAPLITALARRPIPATVAFTSDSPARPRISEP